MPDSWVEQDDEVAAASICLMPDCGAMAVARRLTDGVRRRHSELWEFTCPRCGNHFAVPEDELIFLVMPKWLLVKVHAWQERGVLHRPCDPEFWN